MRDEVRLANGAARRSSGESDDGEQVMHASIGLKADFAHGAVGAYETQASQQAHLGCRSDVAGDLGVRRRAGAAHGREGMASGAAIQVEAWPESRGHGIDLDEPALAVGEELAF